MLYKVKLIILRLFGITQTVSRNSDVTKSTLGEFVNIAKGAYILSSQVGSYSSIGRNSSLINCSMGKFCSVSWNVTVGATEHPYDHLSTHAFPYIRQFGFAAQDKRIVQNVSIGHDVWIGANAIIKPGLKIGNGAIIGAGAVVTKDVPAYAICVGVPAKILNFRFDNELISKLEKLQWWDWDKKIIADNLSAFTKPLKVADLDKLLEINPVQKHQ